MSLPHSSRTPGPESLIPPTRTRKRYATRVYIIALVAAIGGFLFGYDTGVISGALLFLKRDFALSNFQQELAVSSVLAGCLVGALVGGRLSDWLGRRKALIGMGLLFAIGALLTASAPNFPLFLLWRVVLGFAIGVSSFLAPMYIAEMAPPALRGGLVAFDQLLITAGIAISYWVDLAFANAGMGWRPMLAVAAIPGLGLLVGMLFLKETPRWLAKQGRWQEAEQALAHLSGQERRKEMIAIREAVRDTQHVSLSEFVRSGMILALVAGMGLAVSQQLVGINTVIYYAPTIFGFAGFHSATGAILATSVVGVVNFLTTLISVLIIDRVGRRPLLLGGLIGMFAALVMMGSIFALGTSHTGYLVLGALLLYIIAFAIGMGPVFWLMSSEIFPTSFRARGASITTFFNWSTNLLISITFLSLAAHLGLPVTFWLYAGFCVLAFLFCWSIIPETKGRNLEEIECFWKQGRRWEKPETTRDTA